MMDPPSAETLRVLIPSPIGDLGIELEGTVVTGVQIAPESGDYRSFEELEGSEFIDEMLGGLSEYFAGVRRTLGLEYDLRRIGISGFARRVLKLTARIPYGRTRHYGEIANAAGRPDAYRLVLSILMTNPLPILIPCHRVVTRKSGIGSYIAGTERKRWLLDLESRSLSELED